MASTLRNIYIYALVINHTIRWVELISDKLDVRKSNDLPKFIRRIRMSVGIPLTSLTPLIFPMLRRNTAAEYMVTNKCLKHIYLTFLMVIQLIILLTQKAVSFGLFMGWIFIKNVCNVLSPLFWITSSR